METPFETKSVFVGYKDETICLLIDAYSLYRTERELGFTVDYENLRVYFKSKGRLVNSFIYFQVVEGKEIPAVLRLRNFTAYNGYTPKEIVLKEYEQESGAGPKRTSGGIEVAFALGAIDASAYAEHLYILTGNGKYTELVEWLQNKGKKVTIVSSALKERNSIVSDRLRKSALGFIELDEIKDQIRMIHEEDEELQENETE